MSNRRARQVLRITLLAAGLGVVLWIAWGARIDVLRLGATIKPGWSVAAILLGIALNVLQGVVFSLLLRKHGAQNTTAAHVEAYLLSIMGKYLPGSIWAAVSQAAAISGHGSLRAVLLSNLELTAINVLMLIGIGCACIPALSLTWSALVIGLTVAFIAIILRQQIVSSVLSAVAQRFPQLRISIPRESAAPPSWSSAITFAAAVLTLCAATSTAVILASGQTPLHAVPVMLALLCLGWAAGFIAIPVPAGVGVREASTLALWAMLPRSFARGTLVAVMVLARAWQLVVDLLTVVIALLARAATSTRSARYSNPN